MPNQQPEKPPHVVHFSPEEGPTDWKRLLLNFVNPAYHWKRLKEDLKVSRKALENRRAIQNGELQGHPLPEIFRGKLFGVFFATGWTNLVGIGLGYVTQLYVNSLSNSLSKYAHWIGLFSTPIYCFVVTAIAYQVGWWLDNKQIYRKHAPDPAHQFQHLERDMIPIHLTALKFAVGFGVVQHPFWEPLPNLLRYSLAQWQSFSRRSIHHAGGFLFVAGPFVRIMGDFFDKYCTLATRHRGFLVVGTFPAKAP
ncbi:MAG: hypothetical protein R2688_06980 [Fimbriimonadaceae bacterium]